MQTGLRLRGRLAGRLLEQRQIVVLLAEAEEHRPALEVLVGHLQAQRPRVEIPRFLGVPDVQHDVTEPLRLDHGGPSPGAPRRPPYFTALLPRGRNRRVPDSPPPFRAIPSRPETRAAPRGPRPFESAPTDACNPDRRRPHG